MHLNPILETLQLNRNQLSAISGGDISAAYRVHDNSGSYFLKIHQAANCPDLFEKEAAGLQLLQKRSPLRIPRVIRQGTQGDWQYLLLEWLEGGEPDEETAPAFGRALARQHQFSQPLFGCSVDNYIGSLPQDNRPLPLWSDFYAERRVRPLVRQLRDARLLENPDTRAAEQFCLKIDQLFPQEPPALLHGDLWNGNYLITREGKVAIFDPAVYFGHREMDIGMSRLFGGFSELFYQGYQQQWPLCPGWQERLPYSQLYPLLVHALLFKGGYIDKVKRLLRPFLS